MKTKVFITSTLSILLLAILMPLTGLAKGDFSKPIKKEIAVSKGAILEINSEFTDIKAFNWDKDVISIEVTITVDASSESKAESKFDNVSVNISGNSSKVSLRTSLESDFFGGNKNNNIDIEAIIYYPSYVQLDLSNEFGSCLFEDIDGATNVDISYGNFNAKNLNNSEIKLEVEFGQIEVNKFQAGKAEISYGGFSANIVGAIKLNSEFSTNEINEVDHIQLSSAYDKNFLGQTNIAFIETEFSSLRIDKLIKYLELETSYGSFNLKEISKDFDLINIEAEFTGVDLVFENNSSFVFKADVDMGTLNYPKDQAHITSLIKEMMELSIEGYFGDAKGQTPKVILDVQNASAHISFK